MKWIIFISATLFILVSFSNVSEAQNKTDTVVTIDGSDDITYDELVAMAYELATKYPEILKFEVVGYSTLGKELIGLVLTVNPNDDLTEKNLIGIEAGIHGREGVSSIALLKCLELYCQEYYNGNVTGIGYDLQQLLSEGGIGAILCSNPDGFDIARREDQTIVKLKSNLLYNNFDNWKANANGVDLNRNFDCEVFSFETSSFYEIWGWDGRTNLSRNFNTKPSAAYYAGSYGDSERETQVIKEFFSSFPYRSTLSIHSKGEILYYDKETMPDWYDQLVTQIAKDIQIINGYVPQTVRDVNAYLSNLRDGSSGTFTDWAVGEFAKPALTIELVPWTASDPISNAYYYQAIEDLLNVPLYLIDEGIKRGYYDYKVYVDGKFYEDYHDEVVAQAIANKYNGVVVTYEGFPETFYELIGKSEIKTMVEIGLINGDVNGFRLSDYMTMAELICFTAKVERYFEEENQSTPNIIETQESVVDIPALIETDVDETGYINHWIYPYIEYLNNNDYNIEMKEFENLDDYVSINDYYRMFQIDKVAITEIDLKRERVFKMVYNDQF